MEIAIEDDNMTEIKHRAGAKNCDADYMSYHPLLDKEEIIDDLDGMCTMMTRSKSKQQKISVPNSSPTSSSVTPPKFFYSKQLSTLDPHRLIFGQENDAAIEQILEE